MVDRPPPDFVDREDLFQSLLDLLANTEDGSPITTSVALCGFGGVGKTTLARAVCHHDRIKHAFGSQIFWITLSEYSTALVALTALYELLAQDRRDFVNEEIAIYMVKRKLDKRHILLVIDDVIRLGDLEPLLRASEGSTRLITTRDISTLPQEIKKIPVDVMDEKDAVELLSKGLPDSEQFSSLAIERLGRWPLLLKLTNRTLYSYIQRQMSIDTAIRHIKEGLRDFGFTAFDADDPQKRDQAVALTLENSLKVLETNQNRHQLHARVRFEELAIFPKDRDIPLNDLMILWGATGGITKSHVRKLYGRLDELSLVHIVNAEQEIIRIHTIIHDYITHEKQKELSRLHNRLLDAYREHLGCSSWDMLPLKERYLWDNLVYHLNHAERHAELVETVKSPRYLLQKMHTRGISAVEADLHIAENVAPDRSAERTTISLLRHTIAQSSHLLNRARVGADRDTLLAVTLYSQIMHVPELSDLSHAFAATLTRPYLLPWHPLPDLPHPALRRSMSFDDLELASCAITADAQLVVFASLDGRLHIWDIENNREISTLSILEDVSQPPVWSFCPDKATIVAVENNETVGLWDAHDGRVRRKLNGTIEGWAIGCTIAPDETKVVVFSSDRVYIWDTDGDAPPSIHHISDKQVYSCAISSTGEVLVALCATDSSDISIQKIETCEILFNERYTPEIFKLSRYENNVALLCANTDNSINFRSIFTDDQRIARGHTATVRDFVTNGDMLVSASDDCSIRVWGRQEGVLLSLDDHAQPVYFCALTPDGTVALSTSGDKTLRIWNTQFVDGTRAPARRIRGMERCAVSTDGSKVVAATRDGRLTLWNPQTDTTLRTLQSVDQAIGLCAMNADGTRVVSVTVNGYLQVWDISGNDSKAAHLSAEKVTACAIAPFASIVVAGTTTGDLKIWDLHDGTFLSVQAHNDTILDCIFDETGTKIVTASHDGTVGIWDARGNPSPAPLNVHSNAVNRCAISADSSVIVSASDDRTLKIWDAHHLTERLTLCGHISEVKGCSISRNGEYIVSVSDDGMIIVWDAAKGDLMTALLVGGPLSDCVWLPDDTHIVAVGERGMYLLTFEM